MVSNVRASIGVGLLLGLTLSLLMWGLSASPAQAETVTDCQAKIAALKFETENATTFLGKNAAKDEAGLLLKLDNANAKLVEGKDLDAIQKLTDFKNAVIALEAGGKIDSVDAAELIAGADEAIACITPPLETQTPTAA
jgi:hypothetical protein